MQLLSIAQVLYEPELYCAHTKEIENGVIEWETLVQHTELSQKYFRKLAANKKVDGILERFEKRYFQKLSKEAKALFEDMFGNVVTFHDAGKTNYVYQMNTMKNKNQSLNRDFSVADGSHSMLSAVIYLNYYVQKVKLLDKEERSILRSFVVLNSYMIAKHHGRLEEFTAYMDLFRAGDARVMGCIETLLQHGSSVLKCDIKTKQLCRFVARTLEELKQKYEGKELPQFHAACFYTYGRLLYSLLVASDYYATTEFMSGLEIKDFGELHYIDEMIAAYGKTSVLKAIRKYETDRYPNTALQKEENINHLRSELFLDVEKSFLQNSEHDIFYLEAPTGSGKSNMAVNLSFQLLKKDEDLKKIYYVYPFNTLVEQNRESIFKIFEHNEKIIQEIAVLNSLTPMKLEKDNTETNGKLSEQNVYQKALLDKQFLNYPFILTTHVKLFDTMFGNGRESAFGFYQFANSIIVLDEIQSYKNSIWSEMAHFLKCYADLLHIKVIIMSATLPNLDFLTPDIKAAFNLVTERNKYFLHPCFKNRVCFSYELLDRKIDMEELYQHVSNQIHPDKKILIEFITKRTAENFYKKLCEESGDEYLILYMNGDDSIAERNRIIHLVKEQTGVILVATQVIEAGIDIDMDIGYKDISLFDSEEQFAGRINRSCKKKDSIIYFFHMDSAKAIYKKDIRSEKQFTLVNREMQIVLENKIFGQYYQRIMKILSDNYCNNQGLTGLKEFFKKAGLGRYTSVADHMTLIEEDNWSISVYLARKTEDRDGNEICGKQVWEAYKTLLTAELDYARKRYELSKITAQMTYFIYQINKGTDFQYNDRIGDIYYIEDGEQYFANGKLDREKLENKLGRFVDFV